MSVHYKFKSACEFSTLPVDGVNISVEDLKEAIIEQKRLSRSQPFDLIITNAETNEVYTDEKALIPKNSSLLVARVPIDASQMKRPWSNLMKTPTELLLSNPANLMKTDESSAEAVRLTMLAMQMTDLTKMGGSEEDRIKAMMAQSTLDYHPSRYVKLRNSRMSGKVPVGYTCFKCSKGGHWVSDCPLSNQDLRKSYGIPRDQLIRVTDPTLPGVMITADGTLVIQKKTPDELDPREPAEEPERLPLPAELQCGLCDDLLKDAVLIPCCAEKFCDDCIREHLIESNDGQCPKCLENDVNVGNLIPTRYLRKKAIEFDKLTNGKYIKNCEKQYLSPPASVAPLPPHLRSSKQNTPRPSPPTDVPTKASQETNGSSDQNKNEAVRSPRDPTVDSSPKLRTDSPGIPHLSSKPASPFNTSEAIASARVHDPTPPVELYRGLLKDVEEHERSLASKKNSPNIASHSDVESEKSKKAKKKREKKKKYKEKRKDKHKRGSKSHKNREDESRDPSDNITGTLPLDNHDILSPGRGRKRSRSSESASSTSPRPDKKLNDSTTDLFNVALNIPLNPNAAPPYPYATDAMYPPPSLPNFSVPPPGYIAPPQHSQPWLPISTDTIIDDPLAAFNRHLQEKDERKRREQMRRQRSPSYGRPYSSRNWSRSRSRSNSDRLRRSVSRSPRLRRHRWSRSRSPFSPRRHHSPPSHRRPANSPPSMHRRYSPMDRRHSPPSSHQRFVSTPEQRRRGDRLRTTSRSRSPSVRAKYGAFSPARPHLGPPHQRLLQPARGSPSQGCSGSPASRLFVNDGDEDDFYKAARGRPDLQSERRDSRPSVKDRLGFDTDDSRRLDRPGEPGRGTPIEFHSRQDREHPPYGESGPRPSRQLSPRSSSPLRKKTPRSRSPASRHYDSKPRRPGMSPSPPSNRSPYDRAYRDRSRSRSLGRSHRRKYREDSTSRSRRYSPNREESRTFLDRIEGSPKDASRLKNRSSVERRDAQRHSSNAQKRGFSSERSRSRSRSSDRRARESRRSESRGRRRDVHDETERRQEYKSKNSSASNKGENDRRVTKEGQKTPEKTFDDRLVGAHKDDPSKPYERNKLGEGHRQEDGSKYDRYKSSDRYKSDDRHRSDDRNRPDDRKRSDDRNRYDDRNRSDDRNKSDNHNKSDDRNRSVDRKRSDDRNKSDDRHKSVDRKRSDDRHKSVDRKRSDDRHKSVDRKRSDDRHKSVDRKRSDDRNRSVDRKRSDDRNRSVDRKRSDDRNKSVDRKGSDDRNRSDDRSRRGERSRPDDDEKSGRNKSDEDKKLDDGVKSDELRKVERRNDNAEGQKEIDNAPDKEEDEEKHKSDKEKKKRDKKKKKKEKKERRLSQHSECSQNETTDDEPKKKKKKEKKEKDADEGPSASEMKEVQIPLDSSSVPNVTPESSQEVSSDPAPPFSPSLLPEPSKWERDEEAAEANPSSESQKEEQSRSEPVVTSDVLRKAESALMHGRGVLGRTLLPRKGFAESERAKQLEEQRVKSEMSEFPFELIDREAKTKGPSIQITISSKNESDIWLKKPSNSATMSQSAVIEPQNSSEDKSKMEDKVIEKTEMEVSEESSASTAIEPTSKQEISTDATLSENHSADSAPKSADNVPEVNDSSNVEQPKTELLGSIIPKPIDDGTTNSAAQLQESLLPNENSKDLSLLQKSVEVLQSSQHLLPLNDSVSKKLPPGENDSSPSSKDVSLVKSSTEDVSDQTKNYAWTDHSSSLQADAAELSSSEPVATPTDQSQKQSTVSVSNESTGHKVEGESSSHASDSAHAFHRTMNLPEDRYCRESTASTEATTEEDADKKKKRKKRKRSVSSSSSSDSDSSSDSNSDSEAESQRKKRKKSKKKKKNSEGRNGEDNEGKTKKKKKKDKKRKKSKKEKKQKKAKS